MAIVPKVYVVQLPMTRNSAGKLVPVFDISPAADYGELTEPLVQSTGVAIRTQRDVFNVKRALKDFSENDYILAVGDATAIGLCIALAAEVNRGTVNVLRWDRNRKAYMRLTFRLR